MTPEAKRLKIFLAGGVDVIPARLGLGQTITLEGAPKRNKVPHEIRVYVAEKASEWKNIVFSGTGIITSVPDLLQTQFIVLERKIITWTVPSTNITSSSIFFFGAYKVDCKGV